MKLDSKTFYTYGFVGGLLILLAIMLAVTPTPEWMEGSGDEIRLGGPNTQREDDQKPVYPWKVKAEEPEEDGTAGNGEEPSEGEQGDPSIRARVTAAEADFVGVSKKRYKGGEILSQMGKRHVAIHRTLRESPSSLRIIRHRHRTFYNEGDQLIRTGA
eukprot:675204-Hanusia_phi.AAC.10